MRENGAVCGTGKRRKLVSYPYKIISPAYSLATFIKAKQNDFHTYNREITRCYAIIMDTWTILTFI